MLFEVDETICPAIIGPRMLFFIRRNKTLILPEKR